MYNLNGNIRLPLRDNMTIFIMDSTYNTFLYGDIINVKWIAVKTFAIINYINSITFILMQMYRLHNKRNDTYPNHNHKQLFIILNPVFLNEHLQY